MEFTADEKKYLIHAIDALTKQEGIINAGLGISIIRKLKVDPEQPVNGLDKGEEGDDVTSPE